MLSEPKRTLTTTTTLQLHAGECRLIRERIVTPSGRVIIQSRRVCD